MVVEDDSIESDNTLEETQTPTETTEIEAVDLELGVDQLKGVGAVTQKIRDLRCNLTHRPLY